MKKRTYVFIYKRVNEDGKQEKVEEKIVARHKEEARNIFKQRTLVPLNYRMKEVK